MGWGLFELENSLEDHPKSLLVHPVVGRARISGGISRGKVLYLDRGSVEWLGYPDWVSFWVLSSIEGIWGGSWELRVRGEKGRGKGFYRLFPVNRRDGWGGRRVSLVGVLDRLLGWVYGESGVRLSREDLVSYGIDYETYGVGDGELGILITLGGVK